MSSKTPFVAFQGALNFRLRIVLATLSGKAVKIEKIRSNDLNPGLKDYEVSFLRLMESVTNGSVIEISYTGTTVIYRPGIIVGGSITHNCPPSKPVGYFVEPMLYLAPFSKKKFSIIFRGCTASHCDAGIEAIKWGLLPIMERFGVRECALHTLKRGSPPQGGGEVHLIVDSLIPQPVTMHNLNRLTISSIRGVAYSTRVSPSIVNRMIDSARKILKSANCEVNISADVWRGENSGKSPGWGITLVAADKKGWCVFSEEIGGAGDIPEDIGVKVAYHLLQEISISGAVCRNQLPLAIVYMIIGKEDIGRLRITKDQIDERFIHLLRDIKSIFGNEVYLKPVDEDDTGDLIAAVKGIGFTNTSKKIA
ncbi:RCL1 (YOL010W) [Zygosaccharomyces parabailii]|uniref:ZYBA0S04-04104g1_1 n=1 Tax=Zygosaccharomyces bailii (strain CLIB 213 / ATCC 58445 / CBS 680 / BCRC 21525 / NBRC 1098 / NCYC 1416 / NRRL Y-2227) TaxID=1333698 RepID=A0A8J2T772_ZYGB2|nr:RCL1 (YOL010W) [Zygosaccharomyces parabailii]CDF89428.1 ZYBA0S04-04104g1_1 [Zygosaccharomyces bailii CLIB 213]